MSDGKGLQAMRNQLALTAAEHSGEPEARGCRKLLYMQTLFSSVSPSVSRHFAMPEPANGLAGFLVTRLVKCSSLGRLVGCGLIMTASLGAGQVVFAQQSRAPVKMNVEKPPSAGPSDQLKDQPAKPAKQEPLEDKIVAGMRQRPLESRLGLLSDKVHREYSYGVSFKVPKGATLDETVTPRRYANIVMPGQYEISVSIRYVLSNLPSNSGRVVDPRVVDPSMFKPGQLDANTLRELRSGKRAEMDLNITIPDDKASLDDVLRVATEQTLAFLKITSGEQYTTIRTRMMKMDDIEFPAYVTYFLYSEKVANPRNNPEAANQNVVPMVMGEALVMLSHNAFVNVSLRTTADQLEKAQPAFESMLGSFERMSHVEMDELRGRLLADGKKALEEKKLSLAPGAYPGEQWFRILEADKDVGYMRVQEGVDKQLSKTGVRMLIESRTYREKIAFVGESNFFMDGDGKNEVWSIELVELRPGEKRAMSGPGRPVTPRPRQTAPAQRQPSGAKGTQQPVQPIAPPPLAWVETGIRDGMNKIMITRVPTNTDDNLEWNVPGDGYISQVQALMIQRVLPTDKPGIYGFYCYNPQTGTISFRTERVVPNPAGGVVIYTRPSPEQREITSYFDSTGRLILREMPNGQTVKSVKASDLAGIWLNTELR